MKRACSNYSGKLDEVGSTSDFSPVLFTKRKGVDELVAVESSQKKTFEPNKKFIEIEKNGEKIGIKKKKDSEEFRFYDSLCYDLNYQEFLDY
jgi:hypothetical protein